MLVVPLPHQADGPGKIAPIRIQRALYRQGQGEVFPPPGVVKSVFSRAHHQHHLGGRLLCPGQGFVDHPVGTHRIPVQVDDDPDPGILGQPPLHRRLTPGVGAGIARVIVYSPVVDNSEALFLQGGAQHVPYPDHRMFPVGGAVRV